MIESQNFFYYVETTYKYRLLITPNTYMNFSTYHKITAISEAHTVDISFLGN